jgi:tetratricopeptide (TPR) repeat protein
MDSGSADAQTALGAVLFLGEWDCSAAERSLRRALEIDPEHTEALLQYGALHDVLGDCAKGLRLKQQALARAPRSPLVFTEIALSHALQRNFTEALAWIGKALGLDPNNQRALELLMATYFIIRDFPAMIAERRRRAEVLSLSGGARAALECTLSVVQEAYSRGDTHAALRHILEQLPKADDSRSSMQRAALCAALGDLDAAFTHLDRALTMRDPHLVYLAVFPLWDPLRDDPRLVERLAGLGLPLALVSRVGER